MEWNTAWSYLPIDYNTSIGTIENITQRTIFWNNLTGNKIKIKFSNRYSQEPLVFEKVIIAQMKTGATEIYQPKVVTYLGKSLIELGANEEFYSDEIDYKIEAGVQIVISIYIKEKMNIQSACSTWSARSFHTVYGLNGDYTDSQKFEEKESREIYPYVEADVNKASILVGFSEIKVLTESNINTISLFGDSITHMSYYSDAFMDKIFSKYPGVVTVLNRGIGGNRLLRDSSYFKEMPGEGKCFGIAAIKRFEEDLYKNETPDTVIFMEGVNDILHPIIFQHFDEMVSARELQSGIEKIIQIAHNKNSKILLGTIMPFCNDEMGVFPECEKIRVELNEWIRTQKNSDGVVDFAKAIELEEKAAYMKEGTHIGDGLHPNSLGGVLLANAIPIDIIMEKRK